MAETSIRAWNTGLLDGSILTVHFGTVEWMNSLFILTGNKHQSSHIKKYKWF